jgi:hypothetical protein
MSRCESVKKVLRLSVQSELGCPAEISRSKSDKNLILEEKKDDDVPTKSSSSNSLSIFFEEDKEKKSLKYLKTLARNIKNPRTENRAKTVQNTDTVNKIIFQRRENVTKTLKETRTTDLFLKLMPCLTEDDFEIELMECDDDI